MLRLWFKNYQTTGCFPYTNTDWMELGYRIGHYLWNKIIDSKYPKGLISELTYVENIRRVLSFRVERFCWRWGCRMSRIIDRTPKIKRTYTENNLRNILWLQRIDILL